MSSESTSGSPSEDRASRAEIIRHGAIDGVFFSRHFFPRTARDEPASFHAELWRLLYNAEARYTNIRVFRGSAKTSILRVFSAQRIAYSLSRTILYVGRSEMAAVRSVEWLRGQIETNRRFTQTFGLRPGSKWRGNECQIYNSVLNEAIWVVGVGITGSVRGLVLDDYRPDLIILDDVIDEENSGTLDQREKTDELILGALKNSLAPATEAPHSKLVMLQTPLHTGDSSSKALRDPQWTSVRYGCWTPETEDLPLEDRKSAWPVRFPTDTLIADAKAAIQRNKHHIFAREMEVRLITPDTVKFRTDWLYYWDEASAPVNPRVILAIDPVPPPSEAQVAKGLIDKDFEAIVAVGQTERGFFLLEYEQNKGHDPTWTVATIFRMAWKWRPLAIAVESIAYQRTLAWILRQAMQQKGVFWPVREVTDTRNKFDRITDALTAAATSSKLHVHPSHVDFIADFASYPRIAKFDLLDAVSMGLNELQFGGLGVSEMEPLAIGGKYKELEFVGGAP